MTPTRRHIDKGIKVNNVWSKYVVFGVKDGIRQIRRLMLIPLVEVESKDNYPCMSLSLLFFSRHKNQSNRSLGVNLHGPIMSL